MHQGLSAFCMICENTLSNEAMKLLQYMENKYLHLRPPPCTHTHTYTITIMVGDHWGPPVNASLKHPVKKHQSISTYCPVMLTHLHIQCTVSIPFLKELCDCTTMSFLFTAHKVYVDCFSVLYYRAKEIPTSNGLRPQMNYIYIKNFESIKILLEPITARTYYCAIHPQHSYVAAC